MPKMPRHKGKWSGARFNRTPLYFDERRRIQTGNWFDRDHNAEPDFASEQFPDWSVDAGVQSYEWPTLDTPQNGAFNHHFRGTPRQIRKFRRGNAFGSGRRNNQFTDCMEPSGSWTERLHVWPQQSDSWMKPSDSWMAQSGSRKKQLDSRREQSGSWIKQSGSQQDDRMDQVEKEYSCGQSIPVRTSSSREYKRPFWQYPPTTPAVNAVQSSFDSCMNTSVCDSQLASPNNSRQQESGYMSDLELEDYDYSFEQDYSFVQDTTDVQPKGMKLISFVCLR